MADSYPKKILPLLEGKIGELRMLRFWSKVAIGSPDQCWEWQASLETSGYGRFKLCSYETVRASRLSLIAHKRQEPDGLHVLHTCDNRACCNPHHLYFGTPRENMRDMIERGRRTERNQSGAANGAAKITERELALIVSRIQSGWNNKQIAADMPITHSMVSLIRLGRMWRTQTEALGYVPAARRAAA